MINQQLIRAWYTPVEVITLRSWLVVATIVNVLLLTFDFLRGDEQLLLIGFVGCAALAALRASLPQPNQISAEKYCFDDLHCNNFTGNLSSNSHANFTI